MVLTSTVGFSWKLFIEQSHISFAWWLTGGIVATLSSILPWLVRPVYFLWIFLGQTVGWIVQHIILAALYYLIFTPVGILYRRWCKVFNKKPDKKLDTYWDKKVISPDKQSYYRQF